MHELINILEMFRMVLFTGVNRSHCKHIVSSSHPYHLRTRVVCFSCVEQPQHNLQAYEDYIINI